MSLFPTRASALMLCLVALSACAAGTAPPTDTTSGSGAGGSGGDPSSTSASSGGAGSGGGPTSTCGDGKVAAVEDCDDGNSASGDGCSDACEAEKGWSCTGQPSFCSPVCGDGLLAGKEECDDGNAVSGDGCTNACTIGLGYTCSGTPSTCAPICGDGLIIGDEDCDDQNQAGGDGCSATCDVEPGYTCVMVPSKCSSVCGDGILAASEACDDGNAVSGDGCSPACKVEPHFSCMGEPSACETPCGDGFVAGDETCDDGAQAGGDGCSAACQIEPGYACMGEPSTCTTSCGDGAIAGVEICDDGNATNGDGCNVFCKIEPGFSCMGAPSLCKTTCGDGIPAGAETCDDGNAMSGDGCSSTCKAEKGYQCFNIPSVCAPVCGDGVIGGAEVCDDGNGASGDGCSALCKPEVGFACAGEPSHCTALCGDGILVQGEECDDGNLVNGDCCSSMCKAEPGCEVEPNNVIAQANGWSQIQIGGVIKGFINPGADADMYLFTLSLPANAPTGIITAQTLDGFSGSLCANNTQDSFIAILDGAGNTIANDNDSGPGLCAFLNSPPLAAGDYYIRVKSGNAANPTPFNYTVKVTSQPLICGDGALGPGEQCDDGNTTPGDGCSPTCQFEGGIVNEVENNDTFAAADSSVVQITGDAQIAASIGVSLDKDYFRMNLLSAGVLHVETFETIGKDCPNIATTLRLYNAAHAQIYTDSTSGIKQCSALTAYLAAGTYYVEVEKSGAGTIPFYLLQTKVLANDGLEFEPNSPQGFAIVMAGTDMFMSGDHQIASDSDYYMVSVPQGQSVRAEIIEGDLVKSCDTNAIESYLTLYDAMAVPKIADVDSGRGLCSLLDGTGTTPQAGAAHALAAGNYFLEVRSLALGATASFNYRLAVIIR